MHCCSPIRTIWAVITADCLQKLLPLTPWADSKSRAVLGAGDHGESLNLFAPLADYSNFAGNVHGGTILKFLEQVAYACASRYASSYVVTLSVDQVMFRQPIYVGELVSFLASVNRTGTSSIEVGIKVVADNIRT